MPSTTTNTNSTGIRGSGGRFTKRFCLTITWTLLINAFTVAFVATTSRIATTTTSKPFGATSNVVPNTENTTYSNASSTPAGSIIVDDIRNKEQDTNNVALDRINHNDTNELHHHDNSDQLDVSDNDSNEDDVKELYDNLNKNLDNERYSDKDQESKHHSDDFDSTESHNHSNSLSLSSTTTRTSLSSPSPSSSLLSFNIIGFPKMGTSFLTRWLPRHAHICLVPGELATYLDPKKAVVTTTEALLRLNKPETTATATATATTPMATTANACQYRGFKNPRQAYEPKRLQILSHEWPEAGWIVGVRHPVWWFQSNFNYKLQKGFLDKIIIQVKEAQQAATVPPTSNSTTTVLERATSSTTSPLSAANVLNYLLRQEDHGGKLYCYEDVCLARARFHVFLSYLGKTPRQSEDERSLLLGGGTSSKHSTLREEYPPIPNPLFLYDLSQTDAATYPDMAQQLQKDLSQFLRLPDTDPLPAHNCSKEMIPDRTTTPNTTAAAGAATASSVDTTAAASYWNVKKLDICEPQFDSLRATLVQIGAKAAQWLLEYFILSPTVIVSAPEFLAQQLQSWHSDPCTSSSSSSRTAATSPTSTQIKE
ncbi:hypothetical protein ACA910_010137 [Epithemia clementina (nom. ined.)]